MKKYRVKKDYFPLRYIIEEIEIEKETNSYVWAAGEKTAKERQGCRYFDSLKKAKVYISAECNAIIAAAQKKITEATAALVEIVTE